MKNKSKVMFKFLFILFVPLLIGMTNLKTVFAESSNISDTMEVDANQTITKYGKSMGETIAASENKAAAADAETSNADPEISSYFKWGDSWQKQTKFQLDFTVENFDTVPRYGYKIRNNVKNRFVITERGDTVFRWEDYGRTFYVADKDETVPKWSGKITTYVKDPQKWRNLPKDMVVDPINKFGTWEHDSMATEHLMRYLPNPYDYSVWTIGGYLQTTKNNPTKKTPINNWVLDDTNDGTIIGNNAVPIIFDFVEGESEATDYGVFEYNLGGKGNGTRSFGASRRLLDPQVAKVQYRDIETGKRLVPEDEVYGKGGIHLSKIKAEAKNINGYEFDHYETVSRLKGGRGPAYIDDGADVPAFDASTEKKTVGNKGDKVWNGELRTAQQGVVFYYKEIKPDVKVTFHTGDDVIKRTKPDPNPQYPGYGNKATRPKQEPLGKEYHNNYKGNNPKPYYDADNKDEGKDDRSTDVRIPDNVFVDWYIDKEFTQKYDFNTPVTEDIDLYAKWKPNPGSGHFKKAFDRSTLDTMQDKGPYKAPGNQLTDIRVGDNFSYMAIARNRDPEPKRDDLIREELEDYLPSEVALPSKVELFTVDGELLPGSGTQTAVLGTMKRHEIFEKSKVNSPDIDEYYEIETHTDGTRIIHFKNLKEKEIKGNNFAGFIMDTKLERRPLINNQKEYTFTNMAQYIQANQKSYVPNKDGTFGESVYRMLAFATVHVPWKVEFEPNGGVPKPKDQFVRNEKLSTEPTGNDVPKKTGYVFEGWYEDKALTKKFDFKTPITRDWILYAKWRKDIEPTIDKSVNKPEFYVGETASYEIKMRNTTNYDLEDAYLKDILAEGMEKPKNIKLDGKEVPEGKNNATSDGEYYTWTQSERKLEVYYKVWAANKQKILTYDSKILEGKEGEIKINNVELTGSNTEFVAKSKAEFKILANKGILHVKQEVIGKHEDVVVPTTGYMSFDNVKPNNPSDKKNQLSALVPSYEADTNKPYKDIKLKWFDGYTGYQTNAKIPEFYEYDGYQLTTDNGNHASKNKKNEAISLIDMAKGKEYWLTVYVKPKVGEDGPPFYNWDYKTNDFGKVYIQKPKNVRFKFYYLDSSKNRKTVNLVNFETYAEGILPKYFDNLSDYYYKMTIPGAIENKKYSSSGEMKDIVVEGDAVDMTKLPMELPIKIYYTDKNGKEIESVSDFGGNGINNPKVADGTSGFGDIKLLDKEIKDDPNADEIVVSYRYTYTTYINDF